MFHIEPSSLPFAIAMLPFLTLGIAIPPMLQDWYHGQLNRTDGVGLLAGLIVVAAWEYAILHSVKSKRQKGQSRLLGRELSSWLWAPPVAFVIGLGAGLIVAVS